MLLEAPEIPVSIGLQDKKQEVYPGKTQRDGSTWFECELGFRRDANSQRAVFRGVFVHGPPASQFLYISWKRAPGVQPPWVQRIKIPLSGMSWEQMEAAPSDFIFAADITGRRPHGTEPVFWILQRAD